MWNHGTATGYQKHKCRCEPCKAANAEHKRRYREQHPPSYPAHRARRQWPIEPLLELVPDLRDRMRLGTWQWEKATEGGLSDRMADHWATRNGLHPGYVWQEWFTRGLMPLDDLYVNGSQSAEPGWRQAAVHEEPPAAEAAA